MHKRNKKRKRNQEKKIRTKALENVKNGKRDIWTTTNFRWEIRGDAAFFIAWKGSFAPGPPETYSARVRLFPGGATTAALRTTNYTPSAASDIKDDYALKEINKHPQTVSWSDASRPHKKLGLPSHNRGLLSSPVVPNYRNRIARILPELQVTLCLCELYKNTRNNNESQQLERLQGTRVH